VVLLSSGILGLGLLATDTFRLQAERLKPILALSSILAVSAILWPLAGGSQGAVLRCIPYGFCCAALLGRQVQLNLSPALERGRPKTWDLVACLFATVAFVYLLGGVFWLLVAVSGSSFLGYAGLPALLTCNHFHFAGFGATAVSSRLLQVRRESKLARFCSPAFGIGMMWVALGITLAGRDPAWRPVELSAALFESSALACLGLAFLSWPKQESSVAYKAVGASALIASVFSASFAVRGFAALTPSWLAVMMIGHGCLNAFGVCLLGLRSLQRRL
jgi:hypothetical protein